MSEDRRPVLLRHSCRLGLLLLLAGAGLAAEPGDDNARLTATDPRVPVRKDFAPGWVAALTDRGAPAVVRSVDPGFVYIGMPVGGIGAGEVYLAADGRLWYFDLFGNRLIAGFGMEQGEAYRRPMKARDGSDGRQEVLDQGFALRIGGTVRTLDAAGFADVRFRGEYPVGVVEYADPGCPLQVTLEAFSPFVPGSVQDSSWPATVLTFTLRNPGAAAVDCDLGGWLENGIGRYTRRHVPLDLRASAAGPGLLAFAAAAAPGLRPPRTVADFEDGTWKGWTVEGEAFGPAPRRSGDFDYTGGPMNSAGACYADSFAPSGGDRPKGSLTSEPFLIDRHYLAFLIGGGGRDQAQGVQLLIDGKPVRKAGGRTMQYLTRAWWDVREFAGRTAQLRIWDDLETGWGHTMADDFVLADTPVPMGEAADMGSMALALPGEGAAVLAALPGARPAEELFAAAPATAAAGAQRQVGGVRRSLRVPAHGHVEAIAPVAWHFPNPLVLALRTPTGRQYGTRFASAADVAAKLTAELPRLGAATRAWRDAWYDSSLPRWLLDRTFANVSTFATSTCFLLADGRFYANEGRYSCPGTCTHVWGYQQAMGFLFPELERGLRERVDFALRRGMDAKGAIAMRGCDGDVHPAVDGQSEIILRTLLAHRMSPDDAFLRRVLPAVKKAVGFLVSRYDADRDGIMTGAQDNTLDSAWHGRNAWLSLLYQAALRAGAEMADQAGDAVWAGEMRAIAECGRAAVDGTLFNGSWYGEIPEPKRPESPGIYNGCHIDQLMGQGWAWQVGLGEIVDPAKAASALDAIWKCNVTSDVAPNRAVPAFAKGRRYAMDGEGGTLMGTFPAGLDPKAMQGYGEYFNEVWSGSEHFLAATLMWQGDVLRALAVERLVHDRYSLPKRNPWDECECGSHYARALASYGVFTAACGFAVDGPRGMLGFAPRLGAQDFKAAFTAPEGWGSFSQKQEDTAFTATVALRHGRLRLATLRLRPPSASAVAVRAAVDGRPVAAEGRMEAGELAVRFPVALLLQAGQRLTVESPPAR